MNRRQALLGTTTLIAGLAGCSGDRTGDGTSTSTNTSSSKESTSSETTTSTADRETPPADFAPEWSFDADDDWTERRRLTEYPDSDEAVDWMPDYTHSTEYAHSPSREELESAIEASEVPPVVSAVLSKWGFSTDGPNTSVDFVAEVREWFMDQFETFEFDYGSPENVTPDKSELESGQVIGRDLYELQGNTGRLDSPFQATVEGESVKVNKVSYDAKGVLLGFVGQEKRSGFLASGAWPAKDSMTLHTVENGETVVSATVSGESWNVENSLSDVLNGVEQD
jgi:hypothetical protein